MTPYLIGIAGPSGAGKTFLAEHLAHALQDAVILPLDAYYPDLGHLSAEQRTLQNFDDPNILDLPLLTEQVKALAIGKSIERPVYDFSLHTRRPESRTVTPHRYVLVEGLFALHWPDLRQLMKMCVYVDAPTNVCLERRIARDVNERGRSRESVQLQFQNSVIPMAERFVRPSARFAHVQVGGELSIEYGVRAVLDHVRAQAEECR